MKKVIVFAVIIGMAIGSAAYAEKMYEGEDIPKYIYNLKEGNFAIKVDAVLSLGKIGKPAIPALLETLKDKNDFTRVGSVLALGEIGSRENIMFPELIQSVADKSELVRWAAADVLDEISTDAKSSVPALIEALKDSNKNVRENASESLGEIGDRSALEALDLLAKNDREESVRKSAETAIERIRSKK